MDYKELIESLRFMATQGKRYGMAVVVMDNAADAIEELQQIADHYEETAKDYFKDICYYLERVPKWISVKERLPRSNGFYMVKVGAAYRPIRIYEYKPCEWYEGKNLWKADNGAYCFNHFVSHWMPLPSAEGLNDA